MWPAMTRNLILILLPFSFIFLGGLYRRDKERQVRVNQGKNLQRLGIALLAILVAGDFLATDRETMLPFIISIVGSVFLILVFLICSHYFLKNPKK